MWSASPTAELSASIIGSDNELVEGAAADESPLCSRTLVSVELAADLRGRLARGGSSRSFEGAAAAAAWLLPVPPWRRLAHVDSSVECNRRESGQMSSRTSSKIKLDSLSTICLGSVD